MGDFGTIAANGTIRFERRFHESLNDVWNHLTQPALLMRWLAGAEIQIREGGYVELSFGMIEGDQRKRSAPDISGVVSRCEAPQSLAFWWTDTNTLSNVTFELEPQATQVLFLLIHGGLPLQRVATSAASWHAHLDMLQTALRQQQPAAYAEVFGRVLPHYELRHSQIRRRAVSLAAG